MPTVPHGPTPGMNTRPHLEHVNLMFQRSKSIGQVRRLYLNAFIRRRKATIASRKNEPVARSSKRKVNRNPVAILRIPSAVRAESNGLTAIRPTLGQ